MKKSKRRFKRMYIIIISIVCILSIFTLIRYNKDINKAYNRMNSYPVQSIDTEYGKVSFLDTGTGETVLFFHGIFGGYDQAYLTLNNLLGEGYRKIAPSRFGYPGSDLPSEPNPKNQASAFIEVLDKLDIKETFVVATSAGGAPGIKMAIQYPGRVKGLILLSSDMPTTKMTPEEIEGPLGPPDLLVNDFPMWFVIKHFDFVMNSMFGSNVPDNIYKTMLPVKPRKPGIKNDETITNLDMTINFDEYPVKNLNLPILVVHAEDDPMAKYDEVKKFILRVTPRTAIFETGGHLITGHEDKVREEIKNFIEEISNNQN